MRITLRCPHCRARTIARTSRELSETMREIVFVCTDYDCGHTFVSQLEAVRTLSPSAKPNPGIGLPISPHVRERVMQQLQLLVD
ncbi:ogr/Delta-like zinc finger family protein [Burkholderia vietnamiensis]|uniref:ogr/Delta-like zinc finger family protein n=1 Tax=Burkholderia vietnamiensis TaxID=60552 RepID=UPI001BA3F3F5|nr:ogr/Delta-like zinc finger family protein [Burkholderia vietnamiensis]MBR8055646.1 ogr/Delta-like zinc finger family protein [Burkholderia vietnamiensis]